MQKYISIYNYHKYTHASQIFGNVEGLKHSDYAWALTAVMSRMWNMRDEDALEFFPNGTHIGVWVSMSARVALSVSMSMSMSMFVST